MSTPFFQGVGAGGIRSGTGILYAALGEVIVERAGMVNLGLDGCMTMGACFGFIVSAKSGNAYLGVAAAALAGGLYNLLLGFLIVTRRANQLASGLTLGFFALGLTSIAGRDYVGQKASGLNTYDIPGLSSIPWVGPILFSHDVLIYTLLPSALLVWWLLYRTRWGLHLRTVGENRTAAFAAGISPSRVQYQALFAGGVLGGIGGAHLALAIANQWIEGITSGDGYIAVALVIFATWHPLRAIAGALLFGGSIAFQAQLQARGTDISPFLLQMLPYLLTLGVLLAWGRNRQYQMPAGLSEVFEGTS